MTITIEQLLNEYSISTPFEKYFTQFELFCLAEINSNFRYKYKRYVEWFRKLHRWEKSDYAIKRFFKSRLDSHIDIFNTGFVDTKNGIIVKLFMRPLDEIICLSLRTFNNFHTYIEFPSIQYENEMCLSQLYQSRLPPYLTTSNTWRSYFILFYGNTTALICDYTDLTNIMLSNVPMLPFNNSNLLFSLFYNLEYPNSKISSYQLEGNKINNVYSTPILDNHNGEYFHLGDTHTLNLFRICNNTIKHIYCKRQTKRPLAEMGHLFYILEINRIVYSKSKSWMNKTSVTIYSLVKDKCYKLFDFEIKVKGSCVHIFYSKNYDAYICIHNYNCHFLVLHPETPSRNIIHFTYSFPNILEISYDQHTDKIMFLGRDNKIASLFIDTLLPKN